MRGRYGSCYGSLNGGQNPWMVCYFATESQLTRCTPPSIGSSSIKAGYLADPKAPLDGAGSTELEEALRYPGH
ncbi:uncharacterized protein BO95DRAFT_437624 [Aspergillus brunneoviolaceus CBS 621.78]|uniref:Uncharacterized protein n=1 Tax=Aspergillus brunneoviolaceus CBS 621.78 TaxID=1450534 RepID=A0ACD1GQ05_9EURO|nr:hypothetical protein BO95DRAFT_437624 [Aspergillus brunneoviolaceus CBS 621.78]RAH51449.1 hypothetical protein BO95DRAFT_437624 [Aspergillus brunneoviolaceus CBS 621.78]